ncbi:MAG TPA: cupin domain-containing protein [Chloroflexota bacterium]
MPDLERIDPYYDWQEREGIRAITGLFIEDLNTAELDPWARTGGKGAFVNLGLKIGHSKAAYIVEIPAGGSLNPMRHMFEEVVYVVSGRGATTVWTEGKEKQLIEWQEGSLLAIPLNAQFQHFNGSNAPARLLAYNNMPEVMMLFHNEEFIFNCPFAFTDRYAGQDDYFSGDGKLWDIKGRPVKALETSFVADARNLGLYQWKERGAGGFNVMFELADGVVPTHISQFPVGTYKKAHHHGHGDAGGGALLLILGGVGFSLVWPPGVKDAEIQQLIWKQNSLFVAPSSWYHQHFNTGATPARYLALRGGGGLRYGARGQQWGGADVSEDDGGWQIEYEREDPRVHQIFEAELAKHGAVCQMSDFSPFCTAEKETAAAR